MVTLYSKRFCTVLLTLTVVFAGVYCGDDSPTSTGNGGGGGTCSADPGEVEVEVKDGPNATTYSVDPSLAVSEVAGAGYIYTVSADFIGTGVAYSFSFESAVVDPSSLPAVFAISTDSQDDLTCSVGYGETATQLPPYVMAGFGVSGSFTFTYAAADSIVGSFTVDFEGDGTNGAETRAITGCFNTGVVPN
jgi:hypothetical protein